MRFRLVEAPGGEWPPSQATLDSFSKLKSLDSKENFIKEHILPHKKFRNLFGIRSVIIESILTYGLNPKRNFFLAFVDKISFAMPDAKNYKSKMNYVFKSFQNKKLDLHMPVLLNPTLYLRSDKDFQYTLNAFQLMSDKSKAGSYIKDTDVIDISEFFQTKGPHEKAHIKPAGLDKGPGDTIFNVIEGWAKDNEYSPEEIAKNKQKQKDKDGNDDTPPTQWTYEFFKDAIEKVFANLNKFKVSWNSKNEYLNRAFATFVMPTIQVKDNSNVVNKSPKEVKDNDVKSFGNPHEVDTPIHLTSDFNNKQVPGVFVFHKFVSIDKSSMDYHKSVGDKNLGTLKRHLHDIEPNSVSDADAHLQSIIQALEKIQPISS